MSTSAAQPAPWSRDRRTPSGDATAPAWDHLRYGPDPDEPPPPLRPPELMPPVRTQADLHAHWRAMMGPLGFGGRSLWLLFLDLDDRVAPVVSQIEELPAEPEERLVDRLAEVCRRVLDEHAPEGSVAMLLSRPGRSGITDPDRRWARHLYGTADRTRLPLRPLHLATDAVLVPLTRDDVSGLR